MFGTRLRLGIDYANRQDGYLRQVFLSQPFYAQSDAWTMDLKLWDNLADYRYYLSNAGQAGADPASPQSLYSLLPEVNEGFAVTWLGRISQSQA